jgi:hypothetical protein
MSQQHQSWSDLTACTSAYKGWPLPHLIFHLEVSTLLSVLFSYSSATYRRRAFMISMCLPCVRPDIAQPRNAALKRILPTNT